MEGRGKSRRRSPYRVWKRRGSALLAVLLTLSLMLGDISGLSRVVMAGQGTVREEFRIHREDILKAAEEAIENGEPLSEPLAITSEEEKTEEKYQEILPADGSVYEIFPDIEQVKEVDSLELRIFIRLAEGADPASYTLTGDETLVFLYVNGGDVTAEGRVNIDGYVSEFTRVAAFEGEEEPMQPGGTTGAAPGNGAAGSGNGSGNGAAGGGNAGNGAATEESESSESGSMDPEDSAADLDGETEAESAEAGDGTSEDGMNPEETLPAETQEPSQEPESSAAEETEETEAAEQPSGQTPDDETPGDQPDGSEADGTASDENTEEAGTGSADEDKETAGNTENSDAADDESEADEGSAEDNSQADPADAENENAEADKEDGAEPEKSDAAENADSNAADEGNEAGSTVTLSLRNVQKVAASLASPSEAETPEADESQEEQEESEADEEDSYYEDNGDPVDEEDAAETEDEEDIFQKTHDLKGRKYDEAVLDETVAVRAFAAGMEDAGFNREDLLEGAHQLTYTVAEGEARLIYTPEYVRDEAVVTFGIIPAEGMEVYQVTANGEALAETEETAAIASASEAKRAKASSSEADYDEERVVYYQIPQVLEDQTVEIQVVEEGYNDHPAFLQSRTVNGVTVTVSAEEGILPAGTELSVEEVTEQVADAVAEKVEAEAPEEEPVSVTSVLAYDITLWDAEGNMLDNSWSDSGKVNVKFTGAKIEEKSAEADLVEIAHLETESDVHQEEIAAIDVDNLEPVADMVDVSEKASVKTLEFDAEHFSTYTIIFLGNRRGVSISLKDADSKEEIGKDASCRLTDNGPVTVEEIAAQIFNDRVLEDYTFEEAKARENYSSNEQEFTALQYDTRERRTEVQIDGYWMEASDYTLTMYFRKQTPVNASLTVSGNGTAEIIVNGQSLGTAGVDNPLTGISVPENGPYTLKFTPDDDYAVGAITINGTSIPLDQIGENNECIISGIAGEQDIRVYFSQLIQPQLDWKRSDNKDNNTLKNSGRPWYDEYFDYDDSDILVLGNKRLDFDWDDLDALDANEATPWDKGQYFGDYAEGYDDRNFATWVRVGENDNNYELRRFQTTFTIPDGYSASDYIRLKTVGTEEYLEFNDGNIIPINDDIFIFVYEEGQSITNQNYLDYLAFWTGTSNQSGLTRYQGVLGTNATHAKKENTPFPYTDGWYCEADLDNIGSKLFERYPNAVAGDKFVLDVFVGEYAVGGGMDEMILEFVKSSGYSATINYYKDEVTEPDEDDPNYLGTAGLKGLALGESIDLEGRVNEEGEPYLNLYKPSEGSYEDGIQLEAPYIVTEENGVINVLYTTQTKDVKVEYYTREDASEAKVDWESLGVLENQKLALGITYKEAVNAEYGKQEWISEGMRDWYSVGEVVDGTKVINESTSVIQVVYTRKYGEIPILKELQGYFGSGIEINNVRFQLYKSDADWVVGDEYGDPISVNQVSGTPGQGVATIGHLEGGYYILREISSADGYNLLAQDIRIQITLDEEKNVVWKLHDENGDEVDSVADGMIQVISGGGNMKGMWLKVINTPGAELPETGGPGLIMMERFGWMLLLLALAGAEVQLFSRRRRKEQ